jgi:ABC-type glycerol-3-phosphate transport system substrate-binding protein
LATTPQIALTYSQNTGKLPALLSLINKGLGGDNDVFLRQVLTSKTWQKADPEAIDFAFRQMISDILSGKIDLTNAVKSAEDYINRLYQPTQAE